MFDEQLHPKALDNQVQRLIQVQTRRRWYFVIILWLTVGVASIWSVRSDIALWLEFFTWSAVRVSVRYETSAYLGFSICVAITLSTLIRQSWNILRGLTKREYQELVKQVREIEKQGRKHPLWKLVCDE